MRSKEKLLFLESLRGIAAVCIVLYHSHLPHLVGPSNFLSNLPFMVDFFFVLSGFVIALNYQDRIRNFQDVVQFQSRRLFRLYPLHFILLIVFLLLEILKYVVETELGIVAANPAFTKNNLTSFLHNVFLTQNVFLDYSSWNFVSWSISAEFYTYMLFALVMTMSRNARAVLLAACTVIVFSSLLYLTEHSFTAQHGLVRCFYSFFMGVVVFNVSQAIGRRMQRHCSYLFMALSIGVLVYADSTIAVLVPVVFSLLILSLVTSEEKNRLVQMLGNRFLIYLGTISYGIYMIHPLVWWACTQVLRFVFQLPTYVSEGNFTVVVFDNNLTAYAVLALGIGIVLLLSHWSYHLIEKPFQRLQRGVASRAQRRRDEHDKESSGTGETVGSHCGRA
jgi:peptidoglycan/LPS O-acetylase OafA/YrhL